MTVMANKILDPGTYSLYVLKCMVGREIPAVDYRETEVQAASS